MCRYKTTVQRVLTLANALPATVKLIETVPGASDKNKLQRQENYLLVTTHAR